MEALDVRVVQLDPLRVVCASGFGTSPEVEAWDKIAGWARKHGLLAAVKDHRFFGFNNPDPHPGSPNYGYDQWMTVDPGAEGVNNLQFIDFQGGSYAVTRCNLSNITQAWKNLVAWIEAGPYQMANGQCLEECLTPELFLSGQPQSEIDYGAAVFDLYLPIIE